MAEQVTDEPTILRGLPRALPVGNAGCLHDRPVIAHIVDDANEAIIENGEGPAENFLDSPHCGAINALGLLGQGGASRRGHADALDR